MSASLNYQPLSRMEPEKREALIEGALQLLAQDKSLQDVAAVFEISKTSLLAALNGYAEYEWKALQVARAQMALHRASDRREAIAAKLDGFQEQEDAGEKSTETALTHSRIREQLRIAEGDEKSAQWHLERLHRRIYGNSLKVEVDDAGDDAFANAAWLKEHDETFNRMRAALGHAASPPIVDAASGKALTYEERAARTAVVQRKGISKKECDAELIADAGALLKKIKSAAKAPKPLYIALDEAGNAKELYQRPSYWTTPEQSPQLDDKNKNREPDDEEGQHNSSA